VVRNNYRIPKIPCIDPIVLTTRASASLSPLPSVPTAMKSLRKGFTVVTALYFARSCSSVSSIYLHVCHVRNGSTVKYIKIKVYILCPSRCTPRPSKLIWLHASGKPFFDHRPEVTPLQLGRRYQLIATPALLAALRYARHGTGRP
jgi:hypothetical protein